MPTFFIATYHDWCLSSQFRLSILRSDREARLAEDRALPSPSLDMNYVNANCFEHSKISTVAFKMLIFSDGLSANLHSIGLAGFKLRHNGTGHILDKLIKSRLIKSSWFLFPRNTFTFLSVMGLAIMNLSKSLLLFLFRARRQI